MRYTSVKAAATALHLTPLGGFHENGGTIILLGPKEPGFWDHVTQEHAFKIGGADPLDSWSHWAITAMGYTLDAEPLFPFGGPPYNPFITWALKTGETWQSPVGLLVHKNAGLLVSYRGALRFDRHVDLPAPATSPCDTCADKPCLTACPVAALDMQSYDVPKCRTHIASDPVCAAGCRVRLVCPVSQRHGRDPAQTAFHMKAFIQE